MKRIEEGDWVYMRYPDRDRDMVYSNIALGEKVLVTYADSMHCEVRGKRYMNTKRDSSGRLFNIACFELEDEFVTSLRAIVEDGEDSNS